MTMTKNEMRRAMVPVSPSLANRLNWAFHHAAWRGKNAIVAMIRELSDMAKNSPLMIGGLVACQAGSAQPYVAEVMTPADWFVLIGLVWALVVLLGGLAAMAIAELRSPTDRGDF